MKYPTIYNNQNQTEKAIAISKKALKTNPECIRANYQLAKYYSRNDIRISVQYYYSIIIQNKNFGQYIVGQIISLAKELKNSGMILKILTTVSEIKDMPFIPDIYFFFFMKKTKMRLWLILMSFDRADLVNNFIITHTLASTEEQTNADSIIY